MKKIVDMSKIVDALYAKMEECDELIQKYEEKKEAIEDRAAEHDRDLTDAEQERYDEYDEIIGNLEEEKEEIQNSIDYIEEYCE